MIEDIPGVDPFAPDDYLGTEPCCDYRDHEVEPCACPEHPESYLHPLGNPALAGVLMCTIGGGIPTNAELRKRAEALDAHEVVRRWLDRHHTTVYPRGHAKYEAWLDWAARNFLTDPEVCAHLVPRGGG